MIPKHAVLRIETRAGNSGHIKATFELSGLAAERCLRFAQSQIDDIGYVNSAHIVVDGFKWEWRP